jgi:hypothetical protein
MHSSRKLCSKQHGTNQYQTAIRQECTCLKTTKHPPRPPNQAFTQPTNEKSRIQLTHTQTKQPDDNYHRRRPLAALLSPVPDILSQEVEFACGDLPVPSCVSRQGPKGAPCQLPQLTIQTPRSQQSIHVAFCLRTPPPPPRKA